VRCAGAKRHYGSVAGGGGSSGPGPAPARQHIQAGVRACEALSLGSTAAAPLLLVLHGSTRSKSSNNKNMATAYYSGMSRKDGLSAEVLSFGR